MRDSGVHFYSRVGAVFGLILAAPIWWDLLIIQPWPTEAADYKALALGLVFLWFAIQFSRRLTVARARQLFIVSILYLPLLLGLMVFDKIK